MQVYRLPYESTIPCFEVISDLEEGAVLRDLVQRVGEFSGRLDPIIEGTFKSIILAKFVAFIETYKDGFFRGVRSGLLCIRAPR
jgi:hypothetical protein